jgi:hypothetical protein
MRLLPQYAVLLAPARLQLGPRVGLRSMMFPSFGQPNPKVDGSSMLSSQHTQTLVLAEQYKRLIADILQRRSTLLRRGPGDVPPFTLRQTAQRARLQIYKTAKCWHSLPGTSQPITRMGQRD